jgi:hypothetical protein
MSTVIENADRRANEAEGRLKRADDRLNAYMDNPTNQPLNTNHPTYVELKAEVTRCTAVLAGAQQTLQALAAQNIILSPQSSISSISCKSQSINGPCSTGRHTDRNKGIQNTFRKKLLKRDTCCIATGTTFGTVAAHIVPLNTSQLIARDDLFSPRNGVLLHGDLEDDYDRHKWIFDYDGNVTVLFSNWFHKDTIRHVKVSRDTKTGPSKELIELHNKIAWEEKQHHCPNCWKYVGEINVENHTAGSCDRIDNIGDENDEEDIKDIQ